MRVRATVLAAGAEAGRRREEWLATEEPLEIRVGGPRTPAGRLAVTMRTPGSDFELAVGFLVGEGLIRSREDLAAVRYCTDASLDEEQRYNVVTVDVPDAVAAEAAGRSRAVVTSSACGVCGTRSIEDLARELPPSAGDPQEPRIPAALLADLPRRLRDSQPLFDRTGGIHAAGLFDADGALLAVREDVGRHNAVDKIIGWALMDGRLPLDRHVLVVSGRTSYEILQKAALAGLRVVVSVSAPSSLAVGLARDAGMTLAGFVREGRATVYAGEERVALPEPAVAAL